MPGMALCVHAHFYQPPREDPLTGIIPAEKGAYPYNNWNERIFAECYQPNAKAGNFQNISFNIGPTLTRWIAAHDRSVMDMIVAQDRTNIRKFGVGNAMAQAYNHTILPLASYRDKVTQTAWGIADFEYYFGRKPRGMWLPESAVDTETLLVLADFGIEYVILAPWQAYVQDLDPFEPYWISLPGHRKIAAFFYQGDLSARISFDEDATTNADKFVQEELLARLNQSRRQRSDPQIITIASDGELYGHHKHHRELFLKHLVNGASSSMDISITYPALWLRENPPRKTIPLRYNTSWSCHHGIKRWETGCSCTPGSSHWKDHFRQALNKLAALLDDLFYEETSRYISEPWQLRQRYIEVVLGKSSLETLLGEFTTHTITAQTRYRLHRLLESQYERQRMFTSCGFYFEDFDRIEPRNNVAYAAQAVWMAYQATGIDLAPKAVQWLANVSSARSQLRADQVFMQHLVRAQTSQLSMPAR